MLLVLVHEWEWCGRLVSHNISRDLMFTHPANENELDWINPYELSFRIRVIREKVFVEIKYIKSISEYV